MKKNTINPLIIFAVIAGFLALYFIFVPSNPTQEQAQEIQASYELPTFSEKPIDFREIQPLTPLEITEAFDIVYTKLIKCYPIESHFSKTTFLKTTPYANISTSSLPIQIPIKAGTSEKRLTLMESSLRLKIADKIASLFQAISHYHHVQRQLHLYESLEKRAQTRVKQGVVLVDEQVLYLEKVITTQLKLDELLIQANTARIGLLSLCKIGSQHDLDSHIKHLIITKH